MLMLGRGGQNSSEDMRERLGEAERRERREERDYSSHRRAWLLFLWL
jgi:hypothetical protein